MTDVTLVFSWGADEKMPQLARQIRNAFEADESFTLALSGVECPTTSTLRVVHSSTQIGGSYGGSITFNAVML